MSKINIEDIVKNKLDNYELPYDNSWNKFEKKLNKTKVSNTRYYIAAAAAIIVGVLLISYYHNNGVNETIQKNVIVKDNNKTKSNIVKDADDLKVVKSDYVKEEAVKANNISENKPVEIVTEQNLDNSNETVISNTDINEEVADNSEKSSNSEVVVDKVIDKTENITANFKANSLSGCEPLTVYFTPENTEKAEYTWKFSDGTTSNEKMPKHVFKKAGDYGVELIVKSIETKNSLSSIKENYIKVNPNPKAAFVMSNDDNLYYFDCSDDYANVKWKVNSTVISTDIDPEYEFKTIGRSKITMIVENEFHCSSTYSRNVDIEPAFQMANAFTPDNNGDNELFGPVFENLDNYKYFLYIYDAYGKLIFKSNYANQAWNGRVNNSNNIAPDGTYIWKMVIKDNFGNKLTKKGQVALRK